MPRASSVCAMWVTALLFGLEDSARGAEVTRLPPEYALAGSLSYRASSLAGGLVEAGERVGSRRIARHDLDFGVQFAPTPWIAVSLALATTPSLRYRYPMAREMVLEPTTGSGSYLFGALSPEVPTIRASGIAGLWLGVAAAPLQSQAGGGAWKLEAALRTPSKRRNLWTAPNGTRGPSPGGTAWRLAGAFSTDAGLAEPWLRAVVVRESKVEVDIIDEQGVTWATDLPLRPASTVDIDFGGEISAWKSEDGRSVSVTPFMGAGYRSWEDVATGVYLPNVLASTRTIPVTTGDGLSVRVGLEVDVAALEELSFRAGTTLTALLPYRLEHVYEVRTTPETLVFGFSLTVLGQTVLPIETK